MSNRDVTATVVAAAIVLMAPLAAAGHAQAAELSQSEAKIDTASRALGADYVVTATVKRVVPMAVVNEFGDQLIVSRTTLTVEEVHKGSPAMTLTLDVEGGTLDGITLHVSDLQELQPGDRAVFFIERVRPDPGEAFDVRQLQDARQSQTEQNIPHQRGLGILKLDDNDMVEGTTLSLSSIRSQIAQP